MTTQIQTSPPSHAASLGWQDRLDQASDREEIAAIAREFLARITAEEFANLPPQCRPSKIVDADDVVDYAVTLVKHSCARDNMSDAVLHRIASFFTDACSRLSQLGRAKQDADATTQ